MTAGQQPPEPPAAWAAVLALVPAPYDAGARARWDGGSLGECPFAMGTEDAKHWYLGWLQAGEDGPMSRMA